LAQRFEVSKEVQFDYGHRIMRHNSKCRNLHGHRGKVVAYFSGPLQVAGSSDGMVADFSDLKAILDEQVHGLWDHTFIVERGDKLNNPFDKVRDYRDYYYLVEGNVSLIFKRSDSLDSTLVVASCAPTAENLAYISFYAIKYGLQAAIVAKTLSEDVQLESVEFWETPTSCAIYRG
jgi:6-pyruvoyltetrahydropterin/6-carboxytetrahydropterin synthase